MGKNTFFRKSIKKLWYGQSKKPPNHSNKKYKKNTKSITNRLTKQYITNIIQNVIQ